MKRITITALMACVAALGCGRYFMPDRNIKEKLSKDEVIGTWRLSETSLSLLQKDGFERSSKSLTTSTRSASPRMVHVASPR